MSKKIVIIGGGASGMIAAVKAARNGAEVTILEKKEQLGKKLSITGNGRGNLLNESREEYHFHSNNLQAALNILNRIQNSDIIDFFYELGILCKNKDGLYYPMTNKAQTIVNCLTSELKRLNVKIETNSNVTSLDNKDNNWIVKTEKKYFTADSVIYATGSPAGLSQKETYTGKLSICNSHNFIPFKPALTALLSQDKITKYWDGVRCDAKIGIYNNDNKLRSELGELMLTSDGISGIAAFQLSHYYMANSYVLIDFVPYYDEAKLADFIKKNKSKDKTLIELISGIVPAKLAQSLITELVFRSDVYKGKKAHEINTDLSENEIRAVVMHLKSFRVNITGTRDYKDSQVCRGGVSLDMIDSETCESKINKGLFFAGEILDMAGDCGGFNLMWAWVTGSLAGEFASR